jgi:glyoxylase-like metal-dependent hydrolase (beta-lactamase superfamily II)
MTLAITAAFASLSVAWVGMEGTSGRESADRWEKVADGLFRSKGSPASYLLISGKSGVLINAVGTVAPGIERSFGLEQIDAVLLTSHHRDVVTEAPKWIAQRVPVRASRTSADLMSPRGVETYWNSSLPRLDPARPPGLKDRTFGVWEDLVLPLGVDGVDGSLADRETIRCGEWSIEAVAAPGPSKGHFAFVARRLGDAKSSAVVICGEALAGSGTVPRPFVTDWHHCFSDGLDSLAKSLKRLDEFDATLLCPSHGAPIAGADRVRAALRLTARNAEEAARFKSYEWFTKERLGGAHAIDYLAPDQVATAGEKPWSKISPHLYLTGNTYALVSQDGPLLIVDPFGEAIRAQVQKLQADHGLGPVETVLISHAHNDHYTGAYQLPHREAWKLWTLDVVAAPLAEPFRHRAPYLDPRPLTIDRRLRDGEVVRWHEYEFRFCLFPGQTHFTMGFEVVIDGKKCFHTADNFFHPDQFTGSGGWSGRNRAWPDAYAASADRVLKARPDWILAEHGGPFVFDDEDFRRRVAWGTGAARAADALCVSGRHRHDWDPHRIATDPMRVSASPEGLATTELVFTNDRDAAQDYEILVDLRVARMDPVTIRVPPQQLTRKKVSFHLVPEIATGRVIVPFVIRTESKDEKNSFVVDSSDVIAVVDVPPG